MSILVAIPSGIEHIVKEAYYNAGFNSYHIRSTAPREQEDRRVYPVYWMDMPKAPILVSENNK